MLDMIDVRRAARGVGTAALDLLFPRRCLGCGREGGYLCDRCLADSPRAADLTLPGLELALAPFAMTGAAQKAVHRLKYGGLRAAASPMGAAMAQHLQRHGVAPDALTPVPLHHRRQRERGYNQAALLARAVGRWLDAPVDAGMLTRVGDLVTQVGSATREERQANVAGAFEALADVRGRDIVVVDDVMTTGATLQSCEAALRGAGARRVWGLAFTREL